MSPAYLIRGIAGEVTIKKAAGKGELAGKFKVTNQSPQDATAEGSLVRFYLSSSATFHAAKAKALGEESAFGVLKPNGSVEMQLKDAKLPKGVASFKGKYVIAVIDPARSIPETDYLNNTVVYGPLP